MEHNEKREADAVKWRKRLVPAEAANASAKIPNTTGGEFTHP